MQTAYTNTTHAEERSRTQTVCVCETERRHTEPKRLIKTYNNDDVVDDDDDDETTATTTTTMTTMTREFATREKCVAALHKSQTRTQKCTPRGLGMHRNVVVLIGRVCVCVYHVDRGWQALTD